MLSLPPGVTLTKGRGDLDLLAIATPLASAAIYLQGAQVVSFTPQGQGDLLWLSPRSPFTPGKAIRGGIPLCAPWFGPHPSRSDLPQHGFFRNRPWTLHRCEALDGDRTLVDLVLRSDVDSLATWPHPFHAHCTIVVGLALEVELTVRNTGPAPFLLAEALHTYLAVADVRQARVEGLAGAAYVDRVAKEARRRQGAEPIAFTDRTDRTYLSQEDATAVIDPVGGRRIVVRKRGSGATVVWTPWRELAAQMADVGDAWTGFLCVETANAADATVVVPPSMSHHLHLELAIGQGD